jgi:hypothetical protein
MAGSPASMTPPAATLQEMLDSFSLQQLACTYCHAVDRRDYRLLRSLYHDDAIDDHGPMFCGGPDAYVAWLPSMLARWSATTHLIHNSLFLFDGDRADGQLSATAYHRTLDGRQEIIAHGRYLDRYERRGGVWRFFRRSLVLDWAEARGAPQGGDAATAEDGIALGRASAEDPVYQRLPLFAAQRTP